MDGFDITSRLASGLAEPAGKFAGFPQYNFVGGHNDPTLIPIEGLIEATASVLRREGPEAGDVQSRAGAAGVSGIARVRRPQGKGAAWRGVPPDDVLITTGSGQGIDVVSSC